MLSQTLFLAICQTVAVIATNKPYYDVNNEALVRDLFENFIKTHSRNYDGAEEKDERFQIFVESLKEINSLNAEGHATFDINFFADLRPEETKMYFGLLPMDTYNATQSRCKTLGDPTTRSAPASLDWREHNVVTSVKKQGRCGACWAFATTALVESRHAAKTGQLVNLSEQQLVDCDKMDLGCDGGYFETALTALIEEGGQASFSDYPYVGVSEQCRFDSSRVVARVGSCARYQLSSEDALKELLYKEGPLAIGVHVNNTWSQYHGGVNEACTREPVDHAVLLVGYGSEGGKDFWIIKNSWGTQFGENGYIKIRRGNNCNNIMSYVASATVV